jgi:hypothetical protein
MALNFTIDDVRNICGTLASVGEVRVGVSRGERLLEMEEDIT